MTSSPFARATSACTLSLVMKRALFSIAMPRIIASISPPLASFTCSSDGRTPENLSSTTFSSAILHSDWSSASPENPISRPLFAWASSSAITASGTIIVAPLYSPVCIIEVMRPSIRTLVSGTSIIKGFTCMVFAMVWSHMLFTIGFFSYSGNLRGPARSPFLYPRLLYGRVVPDILFNVLSDR